MTAVSSSLTRILLRSNTVIRGKTHHRGTLFLLTFEGDFIAYLVG